MGGIPADADDVVAECDGEVDEFALVVHAFAADVFVAVVFGPGLLGFLELSTDAVAADVGDDRAEPVVEHAGLEFETDPETDGFVVHAGDQGERVVSAHEATFEEIRLALGAENIVVQLHRSGKHFFVGDNDVGLSHGYLALSLRVNLWCATVIVTLWREESIRGNSRANPNDQIPNPNEIPSFKSQCRRDCAFRHWKLGFGIWRLGFISIFDHLARLVPRPADLPARNVLGIWRADLSEPENKWLTRNFADRR
jgi:hypothetical protein